jgi:hypothetical protein
MKIGRISALRRGRSAIEGKARRARSVPPMQRSLRTVRRI